MKPLLISRVLEFTTLTKEVSMKQKIVLAKNHEQFERYCRDRSIDPYSEKTVIRPLAVSRLKGIDLKKADIVFLSGYYENPVNRRLARNIRDNAGNNKPRYA